LPSTDRRLASRPCCWRNQFVESLIGGLEYYLTDADIAEYRRPYLVPGERRRPTLTWPRELPRGGEPTRTYEIVRGYSDWLAADAQLPRATRSCRIFQFSRHKTVCDRADGLGMPETWNDPTVDDGEDRPLGLHGIGGLIKDAPHLAIAFEQRWL